VRIADDNDRGARSQLVLRLQGACFDIYLGVVNCLLTLPGHALRLLVLRTVARCQVGQGTSVERRVRITTKGGVIIGAGCNINHGTVLDGRGSLVIGDLVNVSPEVVLLTADHDPDAMHFAGRCRSVTVGSRSWIATRALLLPGSTIGEGAVVAAGSVVIGEIPPWTVVGGVPAKAIRARARDAQRTLPRYSRWLH